ncbi:MAG: hypothetical protein N3F05_04595 [Candidatus Diapherotrites archaeon]|nr:hypothetical protein [Candidatus Diapherotrites archaeon]
MPLSKRPSSKLKIERATFAKLKQLVRTLEERYGVVDKNQRREIIADIEKQRWDEKQKFWSKKVVERGGSAAFKRTTYRALNKLLVLSLQLEMANTSLKRRNIMLQMRRIQLPSQDLEAKFSQKARLDIEAAKSVPMHALLSCYRNRATPSSEKIEALRTIQHLYPVGIRRIIVRLFEERPPERAVRNEMIRILSSSRSATFPEAIKKRFIESGNLDAKIFGIEVLANTPSVFALTTLANIVKPQTLELRLFKEELTKRGREEMKRVLSDKNLLENAVEEAKNFLYEMRNKAAMAEHVEVSFYAGIYVVGLASRGIRDWLSVYGRQLVQKEALTDILNSLQKQRTEIMKFHGKHKAVSYAIKEIDKTINFLRDYIW